MSNFIDPRDEKLMIIRNKVWSSLYVHGMEGRNAEDCIDHILAKGISFEEVPEASESDLVAHARRELALIGEEPETVEGYVKIIQAFAGMNHSGGSMSVAIPVIHMLLEHKNLSPLTDYPDEWLHHDESVSGSPGGIWQSTRNFAAFSSDGGMSFYLLAGNSRSQIIFSEKDERKIPAGENT